MILDTETTGLGEKDVIIQLAAIDIDGNVLVDSLVKPKKRKSISKEATEIHGITTRKLQNAPHFADVFYDLIPYLDGKRRFLIYNFDFDTRLIIQTLIEDEISYPGSIHGDCIMKQYAKFVGEWNPISKEYRYKRLPGGDHTALGDCYATLNLIKMLAEEEIVPIPDGYKPNIEEITPEPYAQTNSFVGIIALIFILIFFFFIFGGKC